jgi:hypothetical protein
VEQSKKADAVSIAVVSLILQLFYFERYLCVNVSEDLEAHAPKTIGSVGKLSLF